MQELAGVAGEAEGPSAVEAHNTRHLTAQLGHKTAAPMEKKEIRVGPVGSKNGRPPAHISHANPEIKIDPSEEQYILFI